MVYLSYICSLSIDFLVFRFFEHGVDRSVSSSLVLNYFFPPGSKTEALQLGVHLILLSFIRISLLSAEIFFNFGGWCVVGGVPLFGSSNLLILQWYIL